MCPDHKIIKRSNHALSLRPCCLPAKEKEIQVEDFEVAFQRKTRFNEQKSQEQNQSRGSIIASKVKDLEKSKKAEKSCACSGMTRNSCGYSTGYKARCQTRLGGRSIVVPMAPVLEPTHLLSPEPTTQSYVTFTSSLISLRLSFLNYEMKQDHLPHRVATRTK